MTYQIIFSVRNEDYSTGAAIMGAASLVLSFLTLRYTSNLVRRKRPSAINATEACLIIGACVFATTITAAGFLFFWLTLTTWNKWLDKKQYGITTGPVSSYRVMRVHIARYGIMEDDKIRVSKQSFNIGCRMAHKIALVGAVGECVDLNEGENVQIYHRAGSRLVLEISREARAPSVQTEQIHSRQ